VVVARELFKGDCEEAAVVILRGVVLASPERRKATLVESRFEDSLTNPAQEIKWRLDRGAVGCFESTLTWTRGDRQVIDTTGKNHCFECHHLPVSLQLSSLACIICSYTYASDYLILLYALVYLVILVVK
jgi:hypothetical protein